MRLELGPEWLEVGDGAHSRRVLMRVNDAAAATLARGAMYDRWRESGDRFAGELEELIVYAQRAATAWEGFAVPGTDGPAPFSPENLRDVLETWPGVAVELRDQLIYRRGAWEREKKASAASPSGTSTAAPASADGASTSASPAPPTSRGSASTANGRARPRKARSSGRSSATAARA
jgi:hypothetical protein